MIRREELVKIGQFGKPHGIKGEMIFTFTNDSFEDSECPFFICGIDGIFVPFRIEDYRFTSGTAGMVRLKNLDSNSKVRFLSNKEIYFPKKYLIANTSGNSYTWSHFIGFTVIDEHSGTIGRISDIEESTLNTLFIINTDTNEILIPAAGEIIASVDEDKKELHVALPDGLLELS
ncbi:MAG: ribosome maturation factor RimM [Dysgonamonadaceae bacterium]|jgi:16S rRNA processing protein RimM|nr:ribosome maturation factor RimM [Dysgonamonadaceae bacterium]